MQIGLKGPGIAFWRYREHGTDTWFWGLFAAQVAKNDKGKNDYYHWQFSIGCDFNFASGFDFDELSLLTLSIGPFRIRLLFIIDLGGGVHDNGD